MTFLAICYGLLSFSTGAIIFGNIAYRLGRFDEAEAKLRKTAETFRRISAEVDAYEAEYGKQDS